MEVLPLVFSRQVSKGEEFDISDTSFTIQVALSFSGSDQTSGEKELVFSFVANDDASEHDDISVTQYEDPNKLKNELAGLYKESMAELLAANKEKTAFVFASVMAHPHGDQWFTPTYTRFTYTKASGASTGYLNILGMAYQSREDTLSPDIDPAFTENTATDLYQGFPPKTSS